MENTEFRMALLAKVASLYYDQNKTQQEISEITGIARPIISRMIAEARERSIVKINVQYPWTWQQMENDLISAFGLKSAIVMVTENESYTDILVGLGQLVAKYFNEILKDNMVIGISWGSALRHMINAMQPRMMNGTYVIQLIGATGLENNPTDGPLLAQLLSDRLNATCLHLHTPLVVESKIVRDALLQERSIKETLNRAGEADIALVGIGSIDPDLYSLKISGYITEEERQKMEDAGVAGDICGHHYSVNGELLNIDINDRTVGIDLPTLSKIDTVIAVAGDYRKGDAILGALRGKFINALVTDSITAKYLLDHA
ncbi:MAG: sugar-binding transcriptional regulator [Leptolinea sp.]|nr:sugar-binding transcriptional regulator [Leptolinea sp.]